jgi:hypothetical protein
MADTCRSSVARWRESQLGQILHDRVRDAFKRLTFIDRVVWNSRQAHEAFRLAGSFEKLQGVIEWSERVLFDAYKENGTRSDPFHNTRWTEIEDRID